MDNPSINVIRGVCTNLKYPMTWGFFVCFGVVYSGEYGVSGVKIAWPLLPVRCRYTLRVTPETPNDTHSTNIQTILFIFIVFGVNDVQAAEENKNEECDNCQILKREIDECKEALTTGLRDAKAMHENEIKKLEIVIAKQKDEQEKQRAHFEQQIVAHKRKIDKAMAQAKKFKDTVTEETEPRQRNQEVSVVAQAFTNIIGKRTRNNMSLLSLPYNPVSVVLSCLPLFPLWKYTLKITLRIKK